MYRMPVSSGKEVRIFILQESPFSYIIQEAFQVDREADKDYECLELWDSLWL